MEQRRNLTPTQHWELHQGLWRMLGCDMKLKHKDRTKIIYVYKKRNIQYTYSALGFIEEKRYANKKN